MLAGLLAAALWSLAEPAWVPRVQVEGPAACVDLIGTTIRGLKPQAEGELEIRGNFHQAANGSWGLEVRISTRAGTDLRQWESGRCEELAQAAAVVAVALLEDAQRLELEGSAPEADEAKGPGDTDSNDARPEPDQEAAVSSAAASSVAPRRVGMALGVHGVLSGGTLPTVAGGGALRAGATFGRWGLFATGEVQGRTATSVVGGRVQWLDWVAGAQACGWSPEATHQLEGCGGVVAGQLRATGSGLTNARRGTAGRVALTASAGWMWWWGAHVGLRAAVDARAALVRPQVSLDDGTRIYRAPAVAVAGLCGIVMRWP